MVLIMWVVALMVIEHVFEVPMQWDEYSKAYSFITLYAIAYDWIKGK